MNKEKFFKNIIDQVQEMQLKLGFADESVSLYYPYASIRFLLETNTADSEIPELLEETFNKETLATGHPYDILIEGDISFKATKSRVVVTLSPAVVSHIHENYPPTDFLKDIIALFSKHHGITTDNIATIFEKYSSDYEQITMPEGSDFDYVFHFKNPEIDSFYYCVKDEFGHMIYHRFIESDYRELVD